MKKNLIFCLAGLPFLLAACQNMSGQGAGAGIKNLIPSVVSGNTDASVREAFNNNPQLAGLPIRVETQNGTVFLSGYVKTIRQSDVAAEVAAKVPGVKGVENGLIVRK